MNSTWNESLKVKVSVKALETCFNEIWDEKSNWKAKFGELLISQALHLIKLNQLWDFSHLIEPNYSIVATSVWDQSLYNLLIIQTNWVHKRNGT